MNLTSAQLYHQLYHRNENEKKRKDGERCRQSSRDAHFDRIYDKLVDNGYSKEELLVTKRARGSLSLPYMERQ